MCVFASELSVRLLVELEDQATLMSLKIGKT
jgi:hypothetical protein